MLRESKYTNTGKAYWAITSQVTFTCSKSTIEILEKGMKYVQS